MEVYGILSEVHFLLSYLDLGCRESFRIRRDGSKEFNRESCLQTAVFERYLVGLGGARIACPL